MSKVKTLTNYKPPQPTGREDPSKIQPTSTEATPKNASFPTDVQPQKKLSYAEIIESISIMYLELNERHENHAEALQNIVDFERNYGRK